jgi:hypothetical protein
MARDAKQKLRERSIGKDPVAGAIAQFLALRRYQ